MCAYQARVIVRMSQRSTRWAGRIYLLAAFLDRARSLGPNLLSGPIDQRRCMG